MKMFRWGVEGGKPRRGQIGTPPEWFYKGSGTILRAHGEPLDVPPYAEDGGEEAEIAGIYFIDADGQPRRIGMATGNEFSDHVFEKKNYLNLAGSKLRTCCARPGTGARSQFRFRAGRGHHRARRQTPLVTKRFAPAKPKCATACATSSIIISNLNRTAAPATSTSISSAPMCLSFGDGIRLAAGDVMAISIRRLRPRAAQSVASRRRQTSTNRSYFTELTPLG